MKKILSLALVLVMVLSVAALVGCSGDKEPQGGGETATTLKFGLGTVSNFGEAKDADLGIAGGNGSCLIFKKGEPFKKVLDTQAEEEFFKEIRLLLDGE